MTDTQWNWYATYKLASMVTRAGLRGPRCERHIHEIDVPLDEFLLHCGLCNSEFSPADYHAVLRRSPKTGLSTLYRPVGENELAKIEQTEFTRFPPRLEEQPIFIGFVTRFQIRNEFLCNYEIQTAADNSTLEYWIPAEGLSAFNDNIVGKIKAVAEFRNGQLVPRRDVNLNANGTEKGVEREWAITLVLTSNSNAPTALTQSFGDFA